MKFFTYLTLFASGYLSVYLKPNQRIVAIGDLHGDYNQAIKVFQMANLADSEGKWSGGANTIFVQTGDIVDRGRDTQDLYHMMERLTKEASEAGGQVINLLGNHELMNMMEDYRYVTDDDIDTFGGVDERKKAFSKDGWIGQYLRQLKITAIAGDTVFAHGGIRPRWAEVGVDSMNDETKEDLQTMTIPELKKVELFKGEGPTWYRKYAQEPEDEICSVLESALKSMKVNRMVLGHTVQKNGKITTRCGGRVILIDVGISKAYYSNLAALELTNDYARALYPSGETEDLPVPEK